MLREKNLTLTSNPLTRKRTNARWACSTSHKQIHFFNAHTSDGTVSMRSLFLLSPQTSLDFPTLVLSPLSPPSTQPDGLPLTEHWHQMCSSSVDSGTSWVECASGSVNENGYAVCVRVCLYLLWFSGMWQLGNSLWVRVFLEWATVRCSADQLRHVVLNSSPTKVGTIQLPIQN